MTSSRTHCPVGVSVACSVVFPEVLATSRAPSVDSTGRLAAVPRWVRRPGRGRRCGGRGGCGGAAGGERGGQRDQHGRRGGGHHTVSAEQAGALVPANRPDDALAQRVVGVGELGGEELGGELAELVDHRADGAPLVAARGAGGQVRFEFPGLGLGQLAERVRGQRLGIVTGHGSHRAPPRSSRRRSVWIALCLRDFTVPGGIPSSAAVSSVVRPR